MVSIARGAVEAVMKRGGGGQAFSRRSAPPGIPFADRKRVSMIGSFDIGGSKIAAARVSARLEIEALPTVPTPRDDYAAFCRQVVALVPPQADAVSLSIAGVIDPGAGKVVTANIPCLAGRPLADDLANAVGRPVFLVNDANAFALGEATLGTGEGHDLVFAVILGTGVGGAIVIDGRILLGAGGTAGEWGHGPASAARTGRPLPAWRCGCGQTACVDVFGGARGLERLYREEGGGSATSREILAAWAAGRREAAETVDLYLDIVGGALANVVNLLGPSIVPMGGGLSRDGRLVEALEREVRARVLSPEKAPRLKAAASMSESALIGAAVHARDARGASTGRREA